MSLMRIDMGPEEAVGQMNAYFEIIDFLLGAEVKFKFVDGSLAIEVEEVTS